LPDVGDDSDLVTQVAAQLVSQFGAEAAAYARDQNEIAIGLDDEDSAQAWLDIAEAADKLIATPKSPHRATGIPKQGGWLITALARKAPTRY
jgi:hypothetical protein